MEKLIEHSIEIMILLTASIIFDVLTIIYNILDLLFGIGVIIGPIFNFIPLLFFSVFSLSKMGTEELEAKIKKTVSNNKGEKKNPKEEIKGKIGKTKKAFRLLKELMDSAKAYSKSAVPLWGTSFPWTRKALKEIWENYA